MRIKIRSHKRRVLAVPIILAVILAAGVFVSSSDLLRGALPWARPQMAVGEAAAATSATLKLQDLRPDLTGWHQDAIERSTLREVRDPRGNVTATFDEDVDAWVVRFSAPPQNGYSVNEATVVVDAESGRVRSASIDGWNP